MTLTSNSEISFRDNIGIRVARNFQGPASGVWEDEGVSGLSCCPHRLPPPTPRTLLSVSGGHSPRGLRS